MTSRTLTWVGLAAAPLLARDAWLGAPTLEGVASDLGCLLAVLALLVVVPQPMRVLIWGVWAIGLVATTVLVRAVGRLPTWDDVQYLWTAEFLPQTVTSDVLLLATSGGMLALAGARAILAHPPSPTRLRWAACALAASAVALITQARLGDQSIDAPGWRRTNPWQALSSELVALARIRTTPARALWNSEVASPADLSGAPILPLAQRHNVLLIFLEGIPGGYFPLARATVGSPPLGFEFTRLPESLHDAMWVPDFVLHSHQTIRGLYAALCGEPEKLSASTPKAYEILGGHPRADVCLPARLARHGYATHFLQAAGLSFMSKDRFMPAIGFRHVAGREWFRGRTVHVPFAWGADDRSFFEGAYDYVRELRAGDHPWFLTLLTVGTHYPYAAPEALTRTTGDARTAALQYLDMAAAAFVDRLRADGTLENTLLIVTSDESHGDPTMEWVSSWGFAGVRAPATLPALRTEPFAHLDLPLSVLDYVGASPPRELGGRSLFRRYAGGRERASYTGNVLRWEDADGTLRECRGPGECRTCGSGLIGPRRGCRGGIEHEAELWASVRRLDASLQDRAHPALLRFASGERHVLPIVANDDWTGTLIGAQYLSFPARSETRGTLRWRAVEAPQDGVQLRLLLKRADEAVSDDLPALPALHAGEETQIRFVIKNLEAQTGVSFHLVGAGGGTIELLDFTLELVEINGAEPTAYPPPL